MNKQEYLKALENALRGKISPLELDDIIRDYAEYFNEGIKQGETEEEISQKLGIPFQVAQQILNAERDRKANRYCYGNGFTTYAGQQSNDGNSYGFYGGSYRSYPPHAPRARHTMTSMEVVLLVIGIIFLLPIAVPIIAGLGGGLLGITAGLAGGALAGISGLFSWVTVGLFSPSLSLLAKITGVVIALGILAIGVAVIAGICWAVQSIFNETRGKGFEAPHRSQETKWKK